MKSMKRRLTKTIADPKRHQLKWHGDSQSRCAVYQFNTKQKDQLFCPKCGSSIGIDFRDVRDGYGISVSNGLFCLSDTKGRGSDLNCHFSLCSRCNQETDAAP